MAKKTNEKYEDVLGQKQIGHYSEAPGGGTPIPQGKKAPSKAWVAQHRQLQPRDKDGQFTYNSANRKTLKYGPSRGKTVPPFLRGVQLTFVQKASGSITSSVFTSVYKFLPKNMSAQQLIDRFKEYDAVTGFGDFSQRATKKVGRRSAAETQALASGGTKSTIDDNYAAVELKKYVTFDQFNQTLTSTNVPPQKMQNFARVIRHQTPAPARPAATSKPIVAQGGGSPTVATSGTTGTGMNRIGTGMTGSILNPQGLKNRLSGIRHSSGASGGKLSQSSIDDLLNF